MTDTLPKDVEERFDKLLDEIALEVLNKVFLHGKLSPNDSFIETEDQITVAKGRAIIQSKFKLFLENQKQQIRAEIAREVEGMRKKAYEHPLWVCGIEGKSAPDPIANKAFEIALDDVLALLREEGGE